MSSSSFLVFHTQTKHTQYSFSPGPSSALFVFLFSHTTFDSLSVAVIHIWYASINQKIAYFPSLRDLCNMRAQNVWECTRRGRVWTHRTDDDIYILQHKHTVEEQTMRKDVMADLSCAY